MNNKIYGVGINDADYAVNSTGVDGCIRCPIYIQWKNMFQRCYSSTYQSKQPSYIGCSVDERWHSFMKFKEWISDKGWEGKKALDKDILVEGNRVYGPDTCVIVDYHTNIFFAGSKSRDILKGVYKHRTKINKWITKTGFNGKIITHGTYDTQEQAHSVYNNIRHKEALLLAEKQTDPRVANILRTRFTPKS